MKAAVCDAGAIELAAERVDVALGGQARRLVDALDARVEVADLGAEIPAGVDHRVVVVHGDELHVALVRKHQRGAMAGAGTLLDHRDRAPDLAQRLEIAEQDNGVGQIGDVDRGLHLPHQAVLGDRQEGSELRESQLSERFIRLTMRS